jgi:hypothetical protein
MAIGDDAADRTGAGDDGPSGSTLQLVQETPRGEIVYRSVIVYFDTNVFGEAADVSGELGALLPGLIPGPEILGIGDPATSQSTRPGGTKHHPGHDQGTEDRTPTGFIDAEDHALPC